MRVGVGKSELTSLLGEALSAEAAKRKLTGKEGDDGFAQTSMARNFPKSKDLVQRLLDELQRLLGVCTMPGAVGVRVK